MGILSTVNKYNPYAVRRRRFSLDEPTTEPGVMGDTGDEERDQAVRKEGFQHPEEVSPEGPSVSAEDNADIYAPPALASQKVRSKFKQHLETDPTKNTNSAWRSGLRKGLDAFIASGNPFAFGMGLASGALSDKTYDERKKYRRTDEQYKRELADATLQDKTNVDLYNKQFQAEQANRSYDLRISEHMLGVAKHKANIDQEVYNAEKAGVDKTLDYYEKTGTPLPPAVKTNIESFLKRVTKNPDLTLPDASPRNAKQILSAINPDGSRGYYAVDPKTIPTGTVVGPDGKTPIQQPKREPLVSVSVGEAGTTAGLEFEGQDPEPVEEEFDDAARQAVINRIKSSPKHPLFGVDVEKLPYAPGFEEAVEMERKKKFASAKKAHGQRKARTEAEARKKAAQAKTGSPRGDDSKVTSGSKLQDLLKKHGGK